MVMVVVLDVLFFDSVKTMIPTLDLESLTDKILQQLNVHFNYSDP